MTTTKLPELPEPYARLYWSREGKGGTSRLIVAGRFPPPKTIPVYTESQLRAYGDEREACRAAAHAEVGDGVSYAPSAAGDKLRMLAWAMSNRGDGFISQMLLSDWANTLTACATYIPTEQKATRPSAGRDGWRPIESAPRDGTEMDVWCPENGGGYRVANAYWSVIDSKWQWQGQCDRMQWAHQPTHWQPIYDAMPPAPRSES